MGAETQEDLYVSGS